MVASIASTQFVTVVLSKLASGDRQPKVQSVRRGVMYLIEVCIEHSKKCEGLSFSVRVGASATSKVRTGKRKSMADHL